MARALSELFVRLYGGAALPGMLSAIEQWRPDVVIRETGGSPRWSQPSLDVPHAQVGIGLSSPLAEQMLPLAASRLDELRAAAGLAANPIASAKP